MSLLYGDPNLLGEQPVVGAASGPISVRAIAKTDADRIVRAGHYSGTVVWSSNLHFGVYDSGSLIGALQFGPAMNPASGASVVAGSTTDSWLELNRLWLSDDRPENAASRAISLSLRLIRHMRPAVEWVQSFADERCGKWGGVYQACSFLYCGEHTSRFFDIDGVIVHKSMLDRPAVDNRGWRSGPKVAWAKQNRHRAVPVDYRQFRYVKFLRRGARARLLLPVLPYPKPLHPGGSENGPRWAQRVDTTGPGLPSGPTVACQPSPLSSRQEPATRHHEPSGACAKNPLKKSSKAATLHGRAA